MIESAELSTNTSSIQDLADKIPILRSDDIYKRYVEESASVKGLKLNAEELKENPEALANLTKNNENYLNKLTYQFLETESKQIFLGFLNEGHKLTASEMDSTTQMIVDSRNEYENTESEIEKLRNDIQLNSRKVLKSLAEVSKLNKSINELNTNNDKLASELAELEQGNALKVGDHQFSSIEDMERALNGLVEENNALNSEIKGLDITKKEQANEIEKLRQHLLETETQEQESQQLLQDYIAKRSQDHIDPELDVKYSYFIHLIDLWNGLADKQRN